MDIIRKIVEKSNDSWNAPIPTIVFLGDSITQGCFEFYLADKQRTETVFDESYSYHNQLKDIFRLLFPNVPINMVNAGISGSSANWSSGRIERDVLRFNPDLAVVSFGLNDAVKGLENIEEYKNSLKTIFSKLKQSGCEIVFLTENMMNTECSCHLQNDKFRELAKNYMKLQNTGVLDAYFDAGTELAYEYDIPVCDVYSKWKLLYNSGVNITNLLSNYMNHPIREMHKLTAIMLADTLFKG